MRIPPYFLTVDGETKPLSEWARTTNQPYRRLYERMSMGWTDEAIVKGNQNYARTTQAGTSTCQAKAEAK
ncbi:hypothetical protein TBK1r_05830 [Stieleria magnilauensis]|uniref:Uncharacterized protein n=1 Tax=Stieleria magnilauensis TaxID=2527963 RepID=A0ABX5XIH1_9BACT|nr:hypothetical protein TBK1r_05830 [Planctomycetes bacterium TBK1r]